MAVNRLLKQRELAGRRAPVVLLVVFMLGVLAGFIQPAAASPLPLPLPAVQINEVAWAGTRANGNHEWIELYNPGNIDINLNGWKLNIRSAPGVNPVVASIDLSTISINAGEYALLERDEVATSFPSSLDYDDSIDLADSGAVIELVNGTTVVDSANKDGGSWPAGSATLPDICSMERISGESDTNSFWGRGSYTASAQDVDKNNICGSPGRKNILSIAPTATPTDTSTPVSVPYPLRALLINEVAWMGTRANINAEWIELHNPGNKSIDLSGWVLRSTSSAFNVELNGIVPAGGFFLLERRDDNTISDRKADQIIPESIAPLSNEGDSLVLVDPTGKSIDTANENGGFWPAGEKDGLRCSMERVPGQPDRDISWVNSTSNGLARDGNGASICGTPKSSNSAIAFTATPTATTPGTVAEMIINEIAWMGTESSTGDEWIELYNPNKFAVDLAGWKLSEVSGPYLIHLNGIVPPHEYFLLERNDDNVVRNISAGQVYIANDLLLDQGIDLQLIAPDGKTKDTVFRVNNAWAAGSNFPKCSMERGVITVGKKEIVYWLTSGFDHHNVDGDGEDRSGRRICGSPGGRNWANRATPTPSNTPTITNTPYRTSTPYRTPTRTPTPRFSPTPTRNPFATPYPLVVLNEFLVQPRFDWNGDGTVNSGDEFIEIINMGIQSVSLVGWSLDDQEGDSQKYVIGEMSIAPGAKVVFFGADTGILLSTGGDSVRLFRNGGSIADAFTYEINRVADQSWCRLPDGKGQWTSGCAPTVMEENKMAQSVLIGNRVESAICVSKTLPLWVVLAECEPLGLSAWDADLWQSGGAFPFYIETGSDTYILD